MLGKTLGSFQRLTFEKPRLVISSLAILTVVCGYGISKIQINDNPVKWFTPSHPIRVADQELNAHFGGTYMAYLNFDAKEEATSFSKEDIWTFLQNKFQGTYSTIQLKEMQ